MFLFCFKHPQNVSEIFFRTEEHFQTFQLNVAKISPRSIWIPWWSQVFWQQAWANSVDPDQTEERSDQGLHCLPFLLHLLDSLLYYRATLFKFSDNYSNFSGVRIFRNFMVSACEEICLIKRFIHYCIMVKPKENSGKKTKEDRTCKTFCLKVVFA